jgi:hypothetical protein
VHWEAFQNWMLTCLPLRRWLKLILITEMFPCKTQLN